MGSSHSAPEQQHPVYTLVYVPWHVDAPDLLLHWKQCCEDNHSVADFDLVNALTDPPKASQRALAGPPPYILRDSKTFVKAATPALVQQVYNDVRLR
jgi:hypothetical protein